MPELLRQRDRFQLSSWIGKDCSFELLYKISRDGCTASMFHDRCDDKGPTITVLYNTNDTIYGGYLSESWNSNNTYINDANAFLFKLRYNGSKQPMKFKVINNEYAGYCKSNYGPTFGYGHDLYTFCDSVEMSGNQFSLNGHARFSHSYTMRGQDFNSIANGHLKVKDLEVYSVKAGPSTFTFMAWRESPHWNIQTMETLKQSLEKYKPNKETKVNMANILLIGQIGAGKSSFYNSVNSIFQGKITSKACSGNFEHSVTSAYRKYEIKNICTGRLLNFRLCDTRGFEEEFSMSGQEIAFILDGNIPDRHQFNPVVPTSPDSSRFVTNPLLQDKIHCVAFVIDGSTVDVMPQGILKQLKELQVQMNQRNVPQVVYLTKLDKICQDVNEDISYTFSSPAIKNAVEKVAEVMGLPRAHILPVKNYENEIKLKTYINILLMQALQQTLDFADDFMDEQLCKSFADMGNKGYPSDKSNSWIRCSVIEKKLKASSLFQ